MEFSPFVYDRASRVQVPVFIEPMTRKDAERTNSDPLWQTSWTSDYHSDDRIEKYAARAGGELIALGAYEFFTYLV